jgi:hypothetical protein
MMRALLCFVVLLTGMGAAASAHGQRRPTAIPIAVIVHPAEREDNISLGELRAIFLKQKQAWATHASMIVFTWDANTPLRSAFDRQVAQLTPDQMASYWVDRRIRGYGLPPRSLNASGLLQRIVANQRDAIASVRLDELRTRVKILKIDGKRPGEPGYPLSLELKP